MSATTASANASTSAKSNVIILFMMYSSFPRQNAAPAYTDGGKRRFVAYSVIAPAAGVRSTPPGSFAAPIAARGR